MNRRDFIKITLAGAATLLVSGCANVLATPGNNAASTATASATAPSKGLKIAVLTGSPHRNGCDACGLNGPCVHKDDIEKELIMELVNCDVLVLCSPLYFLGLSAQLKTLIDRFYSRTYRINNKRSILMVTNEEPDPKLMDSVKSHYSTLIRYMNWQAGGSLYASGFVDGAAISSSSFSQEAYDLGANL